MKRSTKIRIRCRGLLVLFYPAALPLSAQALMTYAAGVIRRHRTEIGSAWRSSTRDGRPCWCWPACARATPSPSWPPGSASAPPPPGGTSHKPQPCWPPAPATAPGADRGEDGRPRLRGDRRHPGPHRRGRRRPALLLRKHRRHGMNLQVIASPGGDILWVSGPLPGAVHDLAAARIWGIIRDLAAAGLVVLADKGYHGAGDPELTPYRGRNKPASQKEANRAHA